MNGERVPEAINPRDLLLVAGLFLLVFLPLDHAIDWVARRWSIGLLQVRYKQIDTGTMLAMVLSIPITSKVNDLLGFKPITRRAKLDSEPPLP